MMSSPNFRLALLSVISTLLVAAPAFAQPQTPDNSPVLGIRAAPEQDEPAPPPQTPPATDIPAPQMPRRMEPPPPPAVTVERMCTDGNDDDHDGMVDCADADCFEHVACQIGASSERNNEACSDWIDNDGDGAIDCEDEDCGGNGITVCHGSLIEPGPAHTSADGTVPGLEGQTTPDDLIGQGSDGGGENNDYTCSDGLDNDGDGLTDCADYGCRFDPQVTVCTVSPGFRASVVAGIGMSFDAENDDPANAFDVSFRRLQLRLLGSIPYINNSFFLLSMRLERSVRLTFAHFQVPLGDDGHYFALNSGSGSLSSTLIISTAKQPLLDPAFYLVNGFEQGNGAALEVGGPIVESQLLTYRLFLAGGSGRSNGNVGGRFFPGENENFTWTAGGQVALNIIGHFNRLDSPMLYTKAPMGLAFVLGAKYDQRAEERYPAVNAMAQFQHSYFLIRAENYFKYNLDFGGSLQNAFNVQTSILLWPRNILLAADVGMYTGQDFSGRGTGEAQPNDEFQWRVAMHWYWFRNIGLLSALYTDRTIQGEVQDNGMRAPSEHERSFRLEAQFRF